jgi:RNA polymerase sigma-70 factor (ECF subfamily)
VERLEGLELTASTDKMLVRAVFAGDKTAYEELYNRYAPLIRAICYDAVGNLVDAQDLAQDVFMRAYDRLGTLRDPDRFGRWLVGIARLRCREWRRQNAPGRDGRIELDDAVAAAPDPSENNRIGRLRQMIAMLPEKERVALHVFYLQDNSAETARRIMGLSRSGFYRVLERARKHLEQSMTREREDI